MSTHSINHTPWWAWAAPLGAGALLAAKFTHVVPADAPVVLILAAVLLLAAVFAAVHHAEIVALRVGEPVGSIVLAIAVTVIEVALIVSMMLAAKDGGGSLARDTVFAAVMLVLNGVIGLCLLFGGARHHEQSFQGQGTSSALSVLGTLATIALILPNYTVAAPGPSYTNAQLKFVGVVSLLLYGVFLFVQTVRHRDYFRIGADSDDDHVRPGPRTTAASAVLLVVALVAVVLLAKTLSPTLELGVAAAGFPQAFVGVVIAALVLLPEGVAAVQAARSNNLQTSLNLALGSAVATIGLTIPAVAVVSLWLGQPLTLGLAPEGMTLLALTLFISTVTLATGRTTILQGAVHLVICGVFLLLSAVP
jgi:Ca2+:H+ antiporter